MTGQLHYSSVGDGRDVILLHGLFGMGSNMGALARALQQDYRVHSVDLPNHGRSAWLPGMDIGAMAAVVASWQQSQGIESAAVVGHSLGGKVAMQLALDNGSLVSAVVAADIAPVAYPPRHDAILQALELVAQAHCRSRSDAANLMERYVPEAGVRQFLLMSLYQGEGSSYQWRFNLAAIRRDYDSLRAALTADVPYERPVMFVKGGDSDYILPAHRVEIERLFPAAQLKVMPGCGHWLHAEQPRLFNGIVQRFLARALT